MMLENDESCDCDMPDVACSSSSPFPLFLSLGDVREEEGEYVYAIMGFVAVLLLFVEAAAGVAYRTYTVIVRDRPTDLHNRCTLSQLISYNYYTHVCAHVLPQTQGKGRPKLIDCFCRWQQESDSPRLGHEEGERDPGSTLLTEALLLLFLPLTQSV